MTWAWHVHHHILCEPLIEPIEERINYIKRFKPEHERALRLRLLKPVKGKLPEGLLWEQRTYDMACEAYLPELEALHAKECPDCPWDGTTIFSEKEKG